MTIPMNPLVIVHSRAFSHQKIAKDIRHVVGGMVLGYNDELDVYGTPVIYVGTIDHIDLAMASRFLLTASKRIIYGVAEGEPILTPETRRILENSYVIVPSQHVKELIETVNIHVDEIIPHAVNIPRPDPYLTVDLRLKYETDTGKQKIALWIGANQRRKGPDIVLKIANQLDDVGIVMITGDGEIPLPKEPPTNLLIRKEVFKIDNISNHYAAADFLIVTSRAEGFGLPPLEMLSLGKPVILPDLDVFREIAMTPLTTLYETTFCYSELYKNYMWMKYCEPDTESLINAIKEYKPPNTLDKYVAMTDVKLHYGLENYKKFEEFL